MHNQLLCPGGCRVPHQAGAKPPVLKCSKQVLLGVSGQNTGSKIFSRCVTMNVSSSTEHKLPLDALNAHFHPSSQMLVADRCSSEGHM